MSSVAGFEKSFHRENKNRHRNNMSRQDADQAPATFQDVAACFSEEEWKLLHEWQKDLYQNVMKEIHQALVSLGPLIATSVFSVRVKEKKDLCHLVEEEAEERNSVDHRTSETNSYCDISFGINQEKKKVPLEPQDTSLRESSDCLEPDLVASSPIVSFIIKEERDTDYIDYQDSERMEMINHPSELNVLRSKAKERPVVQIDAEGEESIISNISDEGSMNTKSNYGNSVNRSEKHKQGKSSAGKVQNKVIRRTDERTDFTKTDFTNRMWPRNDFEQRTEKTTQWQSDFSLPTQSSFHLTTNNPQRIEAFTGCDNVERSSDVMPCESSTVQDWRPHTSPGNEEASTNGSHIGHQRIDTEKGQDAYAECEKTISAMLKCFKYERTHTEDRPYHCTICGKSFNNKGVLIRHQKIHTGERPHQCTVCGNSFRQKEVLIRHLSIHTGEKPYQCTVCGKSFSRKGTLVRHQPIHFKERMALQS